VAAPFWATDPDTWNTVTVIPAGGNPYVFGNTKVSVTGELTMKWDVKESPKSDGATEKFMGYSPCRPEVTWQIYTEQHWDDWQSLFNLIRPTAGKTGPVEVEIVHPQLSQAKLRKFWVESIPIPRQTGPDIFDVSIHCLEWFEKPKVSKPPKKATEQKEVPSLGPLQKGPGTLAFNKLKPSSGLGP
jgi:hypothetical protein